MAFSTFRCSQVNHLWLRSKKLFSGCADHIGHLDGWPRHLLRTAAGVAIPRQRQRVERARGSVQVLLREVEIDGGLFQIAMAEQNLDGPQIRAVFKQMSGETMPQGVRMDFLADAGALWPLLCRPSR